jgi:hypothetical protein
MRVSSAAIILVPVMLALCSRPSPDTTYLLNCRLINSGPAIYRQGCKAETREVPRITMAKPQIQRPEKPGPN